MSGPFDPADSDPAAEHSGGHDPGRVEDAESGPLPWEAQSPAEDGPFPWDLDPPPDDPDAPRERHDAFTETKKCVYLRALAKTGCILDACRLTGVSPRTVYRHQEKDSRFHDHIRAALRMSAVPVEIAAWQRAVEGVEQEFACGGQIHVRRRYSDGLLRLLLQGSNPKKYGPRPGFTRKRLLKHERKEIEREIHARMEARAPSIEAVRDEIMTRVRAIDAHREPEKLAAGWTRTDDGHWVPPGYAWVGLGEGSGTSDEPGSEEGDAASDGDTPRDSM